MLIERFQGEHGTRRLIDVLRSQNVVQGNGELAAVIAQVAELRQLGPGTQFITQGDSTTDIFLILAGKVSVVVNGRQVAERSAGQHVGEMTLIDPSSCRSATVSAIEPTVVAALTEPCFSDLADQFPSLWRRLALELATRLRERNRFHTPPNEMPHLFVGSSAEGLEVARQIQAGLQHDGIVVTLWTDNVFLASATSLESLVSHASDADFSVLVLGEEDRVISRGRRTAAPRDNVIFELGLFIGAIGRERTLILRPQGSRIKIPSDLLGVTMMEYQSGEDATLAPRLGAACTEIRQAVRRMGCR